MAGGMLQAHPANHQHGEVVGASVQAGAEHEAQGSKEHAALRWKQRGWKEVRWRDRRAPGVAGARAAGWCSVGQPARGGAHLAAELAGQGGSKHAHEHAGQEEGGGEQPAAVNKVGICVFSFLVCCFIVGCCGGRWGWKLRWTPASAAHTSRLFRRFRGTLTAAADRHSCSRGSTRRVGFGCAHTHLCRHSGAGRHGRRSAHCGSHRWRQIH